MWKTNATVRDRRTRFHRPVSSLSAILHRLQLTELSRQQIEQELNIVNKEKTEVIEQFQHVTEDRCRSMDHHST